MATQARPVRGGKATPKAAPVAAAKTSPSKPAAKAAPSKLGMKELAKAVHAKLPLVAGATVERVVQEVFATMIEEYALGSIINIKDFGKLAIQDRPARTGRNPATGETLQIAAKRVPKFTFAKAMKELA